MRWQSRFLNAFSRVAVPNITLYWIAFQALCLVLIWTRPEFQNQLVFDANAVLAGEWWRVISFLFMPGNLSPIWAAFALYFLWLMGTALEANWGTARYNLFLLTGALLTIAAAFIPTLTGIGGGIGTNAYLLMSVFLAFATLFPEFVVYLFFILPVKIKWLALLTWIIYGFSLVVADWTGKAMLLASLANYFLFFAKDIAQRAKYGRKQMARQARRMGAMGPDPAAAAMHTCTVCRRTEKSHPQLEFRYCSACGNRCYCLEHLRDHACAPAPART